jgi:Ca2+-binding EF-hand superfamily protein
MFQRIAAVSIFVASCFPPVQAAAQSPADQRQAVPNSTELRKKLIDKTKALSETLQALAKAEAAKAEAEEAKQAAIKAAEVARAKAEALRVEVAVLNSQLLDAAAAQSAAQRAARGGAGMVDRENADPQDPYERFAVLAPGGPVVVQVALTVNGQPFRTVREKLIDDMLAAADKDKDGKATWDEAFRSPRFTLGRVRVGNDQQKEAAQRLLDKNTDGVADRPEVRMYVAQYYSAPAFALGANAYSGYGGAVLLDNGRVVSSGAQADVRALLDTDADGALSDKEIAAAPERLKTRDADDNDLLYPEEISGQAAYQGRVTRLPQQPQAMQPSVLLGPVATADGVYAALSQRYKNADGEIVAASFSALPPLFAALDKNGNGILAKDEVLGLNDVQPHVELTVDLGRPDAQGVSLKTLAAELTKVADSADNAVVELPGVRLSFAANRQAPQTYNYEQNAKAMLTQFDKDSNGYLEKTEVPENIAQQLAMWDENEDGKVYAEEITASYARQVAPQASQVAASVASQGNSLFQTLDQSGDGRLGLREMRVAAAQILVLDKDDDQQISLREIPATISVTFGLGNAGFQYRVVSVGGMPGAGQPAPKGNGPEWFIRMDRNGDGDVTLKEFLGDEAEFKQLDTNADGFIEPQEAAAVEAAK